MFCAGVRVDLHPIETDDAEFLQRLVNDPQVRGSIASYAPYNAEQEREWIEALGEDEGVTLLVCVDGDPVGSIGFDSPNEVWGTAEIGYMIAPDHWGNGYATEAVALLSAYAFHERRLDKLHATVYATNPASARVLEKVGFERDGTLRKHAFVDGERVDVHQYGLLRDEFDP